jgi:riboflavin kinase / FMN adenylyltransferase
MVVFHNINEVIIEHPVLTIGFFDGVHLGHSEIIRTVCKKANELNRKSLLITFWPHPRTVLNNDAEKLKLLSTLNEKQQLIFEKGIDNILIMPFTTKFAKISAIEFIDHYLVGILNPSAIVLGYNHTFGHKGLGNYNLLKQHQERYGYEAIQVNPISNNGLNVSSTKIREALIFGDVETAKSMLDREYCLSGTIEGGKQIGRIIGYPTANINPSDPSKQIPGNGVYAVWVHYQELSYPAMLNIGVKPTIGDGLERTIEAHIIGFNRMIYNEQITVRFVKRIRNEIKFESLDALQTQLAIDKETIITLLKRQ